MSRHRNVRNANYDDDYDGYEDVYGHSVEDDHFCTSPGTAAQFTYNRESQHVLSSYMDKHQNDDYIPEEEEYEERDTLHDSANYQRPHLNDIDNARLNSCLEEMRSILGDSTPEHLMIDAVLKYDFSYERALDFIFSQQKDSAAPIDAPKPQREPRKNRRTRSDCDDDSDTASSASNTSDWVHSSQSPSFPPFSLISSNMAGSPYRNSPELFVMSNIVSDVKLSFSGANSPKTTSFVNPPPGVSGDKNPVINFATPKLPNVNRSLNPPPGFSCQTTECFISKSTNNIPPFNSSLATCAQLSTAHKTIALDVTGCVEKENIKPHAQISLGDIAKEQQQVTKVGDMEYKLTAPSSGKVAQNPLSSLNIKKAVQTPPNMSLAALAHSQTNPEEQSEMTHHHSEFHSEKVPIIDQATYVSGKPCPTETGNISLAALANKQTSKPNGGSLGKTLADLAHKEQLKQPSNEQNKKSGKIDKIIGQTEAKSTPKSISLAALAQQHHMSKHDKPEADRAVSLASLAARHEKRQSKGSQNLSRSPKIGQTLSCSPMASNISLRDLARMHSEMTNEQSNIVKPEMGSNDNMPKDNQIVSCIPSTLPVEIGKFQGVASDFAKALCAICSKKHNHVSKSKFSKFIYTRQLSSKQYVEPLLHTIVPFDFSSPSPDDKIKNKQKAAFGGKQNKPSQNGKKTEFAPAAENPATTKVQVSEGAFEGPVSGVARLTFATDKPAQTGFEASSSSKNKADVKEQKTETLRTEKPSSRDVSPIPSSSSAPPASVTRSPYIPKTPSRQKIDKKDAKREYEKRLSEGSKQLLNLVVVGHVDAGKSTLMGHLLFQLGFVNKKTMHKYEQEAKKIGKASFAYAWVLDETEEERSRGVTMDVAQTRFETTSKTVTLLDAPGHKDFIPNMITGAAQADVAILVVNATRGEFETGFETGGQTREHAMLIRSLGVSQLIVAINKMDTVEWAQTRFDEITKKLGTFLKQAGFRPSDISYIPCSGLSGDNLTKISVEPKLKWYKGSTIVDQIDKLNPPDRPVDKPFRLCVGDVFKGMGSGISVTGTIHAGTLQVGERVIIMPQGEAAAVKTILIDDSSSQYGFAGDAVTLTLTGIDATNIGVGSILCDVSSQIRATSRLRARVVVFNIDIPLTKGFPVVLHYQSISEPAYIRKLISQLHKSTGEVIKKKPRCLTKNTNAVIELELERPICVELYKDYKDLGRFMLRSAGKTIAAGLVTEILEGKTVKND